MVDLKVWSLDQIAQALHSGAKVIYTEGSDRRPAYDGRQSADSAGQKKPHPRLWDKIADLVRGYGPDAAQTGRERRYAAEQCSVLLQIAR